jgi:hypothetical protein
MALGGSSDLIFCKRNCAPRGGPDRPSSSVVPTSVQLAWPDRMRRNGNRDIVECAGWMTVTARADIGAAEARPTSVGLGLRTDM